MSDQMTDIEWLEREADESRRSAGTKANGELWRAITEYADRCRRIAATLREYADLRERLEGLRAEAERLVELQSKATEGPWEFNGSDDWSVTAKGEGENCLDVVRGEARGERVDPEEAPIRTHRDGELIEAARNTTLPADLLSILGNGDER